MVLRLLHVHIKMYVRALGGLWLKTLLSFPGTGAPCRCQLRPSSDVARPGPEVRGVNN